LEWNCGQRLAWEKRVRPYLEITTEEQAGNVAEVVELLMQGPKKELREVK
jgi:hypothetical protein